MFRHMAAIVDASAFARQSARLAARAAGLAPPALRLEPAVACRDPPVPVRCRDDLDERAMKPRPLVGAEARSLPAGMKARMPQDLVRELVADPGDPPLIHEQRLQLGAGGVEDRTELLAAQSGGVGPQRTRGVLEPLAGPKEPDPA